MTTETKTTEKRTKGNRVKVTFIGNTAQSTPGTDVKTVQVEAVETECRIELNLRELAPGLLLQLAAFGASVLLRNAVNTAEDASAAQDALKARYEAFCAGNYHSGIRQSGTPLTFRALRIVLIDASDAKPSGDPKKRTIEDIDRIVAEKLEDWRGTDEMAADRKALSRHRNALERKLNAIPGMAEARMQLSTPRATTSEAISADELL